MLTNKDHTFSICAYKESPFLEDCIKSVIYQGSRVIVATSTPNELIEGLCRKYSLPMFINRGESGIAGDWNFAISSAETELVTIAHQDDVYKSNYASVMLEKMNESNKPLIFFSDYAELRDGKEIDENNLLRIKRLLSMPMKINGKSKRLRKISFSLGNSICCPSVTYKREVMLANPFEQGMRSNLDWKKWVELSQLDGEFTHSDEILMLHRIHEESETSHLLGESARGEEDLEVFRLFWPEQIARAINKVYSNSEKSNVV